MILRSPTDNENAWESFLASASLCENSFGALRPCSGQTDKCLDSKEVLPFVVSLSRTMNVVFTQSVVRNDRPGQIFTRTVTVVRYGAGFQPELFSSRYIFLTIL